MKRSVKRKRLDIQNTAKSYPTYVSAKLSYSFDIVSDKGTDIAFMKHYDHIDDNVIESLSKLDDLDRLVKFFDLIKRVVANKEYEKYITSVIDDDGANLSNLAEPGRYPQIGDMVSVSYTPASQRYIDYYNDQAFAGTVFFVDRNRNNFLMLSTNVGKVVDYEMQIEYDIRSFKRIGCHYFGMADCYDGYYAIKN
jgi:hypothetical protein